MRPGPVSGHIEKVLLRDLPGLYGIQDVQELNDLLTLAFNTAGEVSLEALAQNSGVPSPLSSATSNTWRRRS